MSRSFIYYSVLFLIIISGIFTSCSESLSSSNIREEAPVLPPDRDWSIDTLAAYGMKSIVDIYSPAENELWIVGENPLRPNLTLVKYDGEKSIPSGANIASPGGIDGTAGNDIWCVTRLGEFWYYDGASWQLKDSASLNGNKVIFHDVAAVSKNNYYAIGYVQPPLTFSKPVIFHYDGVKWSGKYYNIFDRFYSARYSKAENALFIKSIEGIYSYFEDSLRSILTDRNKIVMNNMGDQVYFITVGDNLSYALWRLKGVGYEKSVDMSDIDYLDGLVGKGPDEFYYWAPLNYEMFIYNYNGKKAERKHLINIPPTYNHMAGENLYYTYYSPGLGKPIIIKGIKRK